MDRKVGSKHSHKYSPSGVRTVGPDEFKQALLKCVSKEAKAGRGFALIGIILHNAETIRNVVGNDAVDRLSRAVRSGIARESSEQDLLCAVSEQRLLILKTDEPREVIDDYAQRIQRALASMTIAGTPLRPAFDVRVVESGGHLDVGALLSELGCELDEHAELRENVRRERRHTGELKSWHSRYRMEDGERAIDSWSGKPVNLRRFEIGPHDDEDTRQSLLKNAKNLQAIDHAGIAAVVDFWLDDEQMIVVEPGDGTASSISKQDDPESAREFAEQYLSILLYLQSLTPPVVPGKNNLYVVSKKKLVLTGWQTAWLREVAEHKTAPPKEESYVALFRSFVKELGIEDLTKTVTNTELSTLHKIRAALKHA